MKIKSFFSLITNHALLMRIRPDPKGMIVLSEGFETVYASECRAAHIPDLLALSIRAHGQVLLHLA